MTIRKTSPPTAPRGLDQLKAAVATFRHCLDLQLAQRRARRDIEPHCGSGSSITPTMERAIAETRRQETNLVAFLEVPDRDSESLAGIGQEPYGHTAVRCLCRAEAPARRAQEEITRSREKIKTELAPASRWVGACRKATRASFRARNQTARGLATAAGDKMASAARTSTTASRAPAAVINKPRSTSWKIWDAVIPFHPC